MAWVPPGGFDAPHASSMCAPASQSLVYSSKQGVRDCRVFLGGQSESGWRVFMPASVATYFLITKPPSLPHSCCL